MQAGIYLHNVRPLRATPTDCVGGGPWGLFHTSQEFKSMTVQVTFLYCEEAKRWQTVVSGDVHNKRGAVEAFSSVVKTCQQLQPAALPLSRAVLTHVSDGREVYQIVPAIIN